MAELSELIKCVSEQCSNLENLMISRLKTKDELINRLHDELDYYKKDSAGKFENQLLKAVIKIRQDMKKKINNNLIMEKDYSQVFQEYMYVFEDITDLLEQQLCDEIQSNPGDIFNPALQQAKIEFTDDITLDKKVKCTINSGYFKDGKVLVPERVIVYQYKKTETEDLL